MSIRNGHRWTQKPPVGTMLDRGHPLAQGLVAYWLLNEGGGNTLFDLVSGLKLKQSGTITGWAVGSLGPEVQNNGAAGYFGVASFPLTGLPLTLGCVSRALTGNNGSYRDAFGIYNIIASAYYGLGWTGTTGIPAMVPGSPGGLASFAALGVNVQATLVGTFKDTSSKATLFVNGVNNGQTAGNVSAVTFHDTRVCFGAAGSPFTACTLAAVWNRVLSDREIALWSADPYGVILAPPVRTYMLLGSVYRRQHAFAGGASGSTASASYAATAAGSTLVALLSTESAGTPTTPAGWTKRVGITLNKLSVYDKVNDAGGTTSVSFTLNGTATWNLSLLEYAGLGTAPAVLTATEATTSSGTLSAGPVAPGAACAVVAGFTNNNGDTFSAPTGGFATVDQGQAGGTDALAVLDLTGAAGTYTAGASIPAGNSSAGVIASYAVAASAVFYPGLESWFPDRPPASPTVAVPY